MKCLLCFNNLVHVFNPNTKERKGLITYFKTYCIIILKKHVENDFIIIVKSFDKEINALIRRPIEKQLTTKNNKCFKKCNI
jgi:hypothetical protein